VLSRLAGRAPCSHLKLLDDGWIGCELHPNKPEGCRKFPTVEDFLRGRVPSCCSYKLVELK